MQWPGTYASGIEDATGALVLGSYVVRRAEQAVRVALTDTRVVSVSGARQVGKSTLVEAVTRGLNDTTIRTLDRQSDLQAAITDPERFVRHDGLLVIDEIQRSPELLLSIKAEVDRDQRPGHFLLTGSARVLGLRRLPDALVGRMETIEVWPFSQGELLGRRERFVDSAFSDDDLVAGDPLDRGDYFARAARGGFAEALKREPRRRTKFFENYVNDLIDRDVTQLAEIERRPQLRRLLALTSSRMAAPLSISNLASVLGIAAATVEKYLALFEEVFLLKQIPAWSNSTTSRATRQRKALVVDSGLALFLTGETLARVQRDARTDGGLLENFVLGELGRQLTFNDQRATLHHFRTRDGVEVDAVLEAADGRIVGVEVKAADTVRSDDFRHLRYLQQRIGDQFHQGVLLHTGTVTHSYGDRLIARPISSLWAE